MKKNKTNSYPVFYKKLRRQLSKKQQYLLKYTLKKYLFKNSKTSKKKILEIGFGYGENLINLSKKNSDKLIIGCEIYEPGIASAVEKINNEGLKNTFIFKENIFLLLRKLKKNYIDKVFILFPDPWPKKKHFKRRLISNKFLIQVCKILKKKGLIIISTDSENYLKSILKEFFLNKNFLWVDRKTADCYKRPKELIESKYEKKATLKNNKKYFLKFKKMC